MRGKGKAGKSLLVVVLLSSAVGCGIATGEEDWSEVEELKNRQLVVVVDPGRELTDPNPLQPPGPELPPLDLVALGLAPAPMEPATVDPANTDKAKFVWGAMGDSFASGEGNPEKGISNSSNVESFTGLRWGDDQSIWIDPGLGTHAADVTTCHRSDEAGAPKAHRRMQAAHPTIEFKLGFVACSGATTANLRVDGDFGPSVVPAAMLGHSKVEQPAQISRIKNLKAANEGQLDAVYMSVGGNDFGFDSLVKDCTRPLADCRQTWQGANGLGVSGINAMLKGYEKLDRRIEQELGEVPVLLHLVPNPLHDGSGNPPACRGPDYDATGEVGFGRFDDFLQDNISNEEAAFAFGIPAILNQTMQEAANVHGWRTVRAPNFNGHGICTANPFANLNSQALHLQGRDAPDTSFFLVSNGLLHPNNAGYEEYADRIVEGLEELVAAKVRTSLRRPLRADIAAVVKHGKLTVVWQDRAAGEDRYEIEVTPVRPEDAALLLTPPGTRSLPPPSDGVPVQPGFIAALPANAQQFIHLPSGKGMFRYRMRACTMSVAGAPCGQYSHPIVGANFAPSIPTGLTAQLINNGTLNGTIYRWDAQPEALQFVLRLTGEFEGAEVRLGAANGVYRPGPGQPAEVSACNRLGCTRYSSVIPAP